MLLKYDKKHNENFDNGLVKKKDLHRQMFTKRYKRQAIIKENTNSRYKKLE